MKHRKNEYGVTPEQFVTAWMRSYHAGEGMAGVVARTGMPKAIVSARASGYRRLGVKLPRFPRGPRRLIDVAALSRKCVEWKLAYEAARAAKGGAA